MHESPSLYLWLESKTIIPGSILELIIKYLSAGAILCSREDGSLGLRNILAEDYDRVVHAVDEKHNCITINTHRTDAISSIVDSGPSVKSCPASWCKHAKFNVFALSIQIAHEEEQIVHSVGGEIVILGCRHQFCRSIAEKAHAIVTARRDGWTIEYGKTSIETNDVNDVQTMIETLKKVTLRNKSEA